MFPPYISQRRLAQKCFCQSSNRTLDSANRSPFQLLIFVLSSLIWVFELIYFMFSKGIGAELDFLISKLGKRPIYFFLLT